MIRTTKRSAEQIAAMEKRAAVMEALLKIKDAKARYAAYCKIYGTEREFARKHRREIARTERELKKLNAIM